MRIIMIVSNTIVQVLSSKNLVHLWDPRVSPSLSKLFNLFIISNRVISNRAQLKLIASLFLTSFLTPNLYLLISFFHHYLNFLIFFAKFVLWIEFVWHSNSIYYKQISILISKSLHIVKNFFKNFYRYRLCKGLIYLICNISHHPSFLTNPLCF